MTKDRTTVEEWFLAHGLPYFVAEERAAARAGLRPRRLVPILVLLVAVAAAGGGLLGWLSEQYTAAPALWLSVTVLGLLWYASSALHARPILGFALSRTLGSVRFLVPMASRALPLLLVFVTFLFVNAEAWQMTTNLPFGLLWFTVLLMFGLAVLFLLVRLPEEVDRVDDEVDDAFITRACAGTPLEHASRGVAADPSIDPQDFAQVTGFERWNLILVLLVIQTVQVLLLSVTVFAFFMFFGSLVMETETQLAWTGADTVGEVPFLPHVSVSLMKVSLFLASFSGFYFTVSAVTDETYRKQFFSVVESQLERAVGMRAVYLATRERD
ncbi:hypothetical protein GCM10011376_19550 [Nocardioides flavus (ex Wang et al. 2016)]|uniref:Uncharacterized protein n=1 Tax=Nocardioides flavus (ex Wang et al. 2016) TaxID=2058780 RepID=A0ABQ3HI58_9ACTN|nr:hypothetical protein [Nocardioides flavus (ex Wang et al. 2016)]GHE17345.1 hypothetical protein GCM10011376_19550 [Nocardioides flavus (ex Wang et al. 2016)]